MQFTRKCFAITYSVFSILYYLSILEYLVSVITSDKNILDEHSKRCCISLIKILLYTACSLLRLGANSKEVSILAQIISLNLNVYITCNDYFWDRVINTSVITAFSHLGRQGKETLSKDHPCRIFLDLWTICSARMSVACGSRGQLMLSHNATTEPSAWDPSVLLKDYLRTRDVVMCPLFNRSHIVV